MTIRTTGTIVDATVFAGSDDRDNFPVVLNKEIRGSVQYFKTIADRDTWSRNYTSRLYNSISIQFDNTDKSQKNARVFEWTGELPDGSDGNWQEINFISETDIIKWKSIDTAKEGTGERLVFDIGLTASQNQESKDINVSISNSFLSNLFPAEYIAYANNQPSLGGSMEDELHRTVFLFDKSKILVSPFIVVDKEKRVIDVTNPPNTNYEDYLISVILRFDGEANEKGDIRLFMMSSLPEHPDIEVYLEDINGHEMVSQRQYEAGDKYGDIVLAGIVRISRTTPLTFHVRSTYNYPLRLKSKLRSISGILIQSINSKDQALHIFENDTGFDINYLESYFPSPYSDFSYALSKPMAKKTFTPFSHNPPQAGSDVFSDDSWFFIPLETDADITITPDKEMIIEAQSKNTPSGLVFPFFNMVYYFYSEETYFLRGKEVEIEVYLGLRSLSSELTICSWSGEGEPDENMSIVLSVSNTGEFKYAYGWKEVSKKTIAAGEPSIGSLRGTVPNDARLIGLIFSPFQKESPLSYKITNLKINVYPEFTIGRIKNFGPKEDNNIIFTKGYAKFVQSIHNYVSIRYTINSIESAAPMGVLQTDKLTLPVILDPKVNTIPSSQLKVGEGAIHFLDDIENVEISTSILLVPGEKLPDKEIATVTFKWYSFETNGSMKEVLNSTSTVTISKGSPAVTKTFSFRQDFVSSGTRLGLRMHTNGNDYAFLETTKDHIPLIENIVSGDKV